MSGIRGAITTKRGMLGISVIVFLIAGAMTAVAALPPGGTFIDDDGNPHEGNIEAIAAVGITAGCNPPTNNRFCPSRTVTRGEMATFFTRAFPLAATNQDFFSDDNGTTHEKGINTIAAAKVTLGCNPPTNTHYCPNRTVTRGEMATFLTRVLKLPHSGSDFFQDDNGTTHEKGINAIAAAGIAVWCGPGNYCPNAQLPRDVMATMLARALGLDAQVPPPPTTTLPPSSGGMPFEVTRLKDLPNSQFYHVVAVGEATRKTGTGEYDFTDGTATVELELKGDVRIVPLNVCLVVRGSPEGGGTDLAVRDAYGNPNAHGVTSLGVRCPRGIDDL